MSNVRKARSRTCLFDKLRPELEPKGMFLFVGLNKGKNNSRNIETCIQARRVDEPIKERKAKAKAAATKG